MTSLVYCSLEFLALLQVSVFQLLCHLYFLNYFGVFSRGYTDSSLCTVYVPFKGIYWLIPVYCLCSVTLPLEGRTVSPYLLSLFLWREITVSTLPFRYCVIVPLLILSGRTVSPFAVFLLLFLKGELSQPYDLILFLLLFLWRGERLSQPYTVSCYCSWWEILSRPYPVFCYCSSGGEKDCLDPILFPVIVPEGRYCLNLVLFSVVVLWREILSQPIPFSCVPVRPRAPSWPCWERRVLASVHLSTKAMCPESFGGVRSTGFYSICDVS